MASFLTLETDGFTGWLAISYFVVLFRLSASLIAHFFFIWDLKQSKVFMIEY